MTTLELERTDLDALLALAGRAESKTAQERFALLDARDQLAQRDVSEPAGADQLQLFDPSEYDA